MRYWATPFQLSTTARSTLIEAGLQPWSYRGSALPDDGTLLLYDSPDQLITTVRTGPDAEALTPLSFMQGYRLLLDWSEQTGQPLLSISQLQWLGPQDLRIWFGDAAAAFPPPPIPLPIPPLLAAVSLSLIGAEPALLDCYHDLELRAALLGREPDLRYQERLQQACQQGDGLLQAFCVSQRVQAAFPDLEQRLATSETDIREARKASEQTLSNLHQVQHALERAVLAEGEMDFELKARDRELQELRRTKVSQESAHELAMAVQEREHSLELETVCSQLESRLAELEQRLASRDMELREAREAAELNLQQLRQVQEELEHFFLADREKQNQLDAGVRDLDELRQTKAAQESAHELAHAAQERVHELELQALGQQFKQQLAELEQLVATRDTELRQGREEAVTTQLQLRQVQDELEQYFIAAGEMQRQLEVGNRDLVELRQAIADQESAHEQELEAVRQRLEAQMAALEQDLASRDTDLRLARESAQLTIEQLDQVQEELEHYFLKARANDQIAQAQLEQLQRAQVLMARMHPNVLPTAPYPRALEVEVEVLPEEIAAIPNLSLQTQALLSTYAASLKRAGALLGRARRS